MSIKSTIMHGNQKSLIISLAKAELSVCPYPELHSIVCSINENVLILTGQVPSYYHKQMAQAKLLDKFEGLIALDNRIFVKH